MHTLTHACIHAYMLAHKPGVVSGIHNPNVKETETEDLWHLVVGQSISDSQDIGSARDPGLKDYRREQSRRHLTLASNFHFHICVCKHSN